MNIHAEGQVPKLSIVVCTYRRPDHLARLLGALQKQTVPAGDFETIVVDKDPEPNIEVQELCRPDNFQEANIRYIHHTRLGISSARNRGVNEARAGWVGFLDDDVLPPPDWVGKVLTSQGISQAMILGGPFKPFYTSTPPRWFKDIYATQYFGDQAHWMKRNKYLAGANMIWSRELILCLGGFSEKFGFIGSKQVYCDDTELGQRAYLEGIGSWYDPALEILHHFDARRMSVRWFLGTIIRHSQVKARLVLRETNLVDKGPIFRQVLSISKKLLIHKIFFLKTCWMVLFWKRKEYPYLENYIIEEIGAEIRQVILNLEMIWLLFFEPGKASNI